MAARDDAHVQKISDVLKARRRNPPSDFIAVGYATLLDVSLMTSARRDHWITRNNEGALGLVNGRYRLVPDGAPDPAALLELLRDAETRGRATITPDLASLRQRLE